QPAQQGLEADGELTTSTVRNGQGPLAYPCSPELLNLHGKRLLLRMATRDEKELAGHVQDHLAVERPLPARNFAEDVSRKSAAGLVKTHDVPPGRAVRIERGVN